MDLSQYIQSKLQQKPLLLMTHAVVGYPSLDANWKMLELMESAGVDLVELQLPFSEPSADGPLFVKANQTALVQGSNWNEYFDFMSEARKRFSFPFIFVGYYNTVFCMEHSGFCERLHNSGGQGFIIPDLPVEEFGNLYEQSAAKNLHPILLCAPTNTDSRLKELASHGSAFLYCVARKGVTGAKTEVTADVFQFLKRCRQVSTIPLALGFGLSTKQDLQQVHGSAEIAIVGSALLKIWETQGEAAYEDRLNELSAGCLSTESLFPDE